MRTIIYLDNNATTPLDPQVLESLVLNLKTSFGNPSSSHFLGQEAKALLQKARDKIAKYFHVSSREVIFTSGATEALNLLLRGFLEGKKAHVVTSDLEHSAVFATLKSLESEEIKVSYMNGGLYGAPTLSQVEEACKNGASLIVLMAVNNETGVRTDIEAIAAFAKEKNIPFIVDGVALFGKELFLIPEGVSAICFSGHKIHAPKGIGFMIVRKSIKLKPLMTGGDQEFGKRAGTENMPAIIALETAIDVLEKSLSDAVLRMKTLRDRFEESLLANLSNVEINGKGPRVCNVSNICFKGIDGELLLAKLGMEGIFASLGSACASGALEPSRILLQMGLSMEEAVSSIRFSFSRFTTEEEIEKAVKIIIKIVKNEKN